jgi:hypothetical protein
VDQARLVDCVFHTNAKRLADIGRDAERPVGLADAIDGSRLSVHLDIAALQLKDRPRRRIVVRPAGGRVLRSRDVTQARRRRRKGSHYDGASGKHDEVSSKGRIESLLSGLLSKQARRASR